MKCRAPSTLALFVCVASPSWSEIAMKTRSNPQTGPIWKVCVLPPDATLTRVGMKGGASLPKESDEWAAKLGATLKHAISEAGAKVTGDLSLDQLQHNDEARQSVVRLKQKYASIAVQLRKKPGGVEKGRYTLGDEVALLSCAAEADSLAFVNARGMAFTGGKKTFDILVTGLPGILMARVRFDIWIALVDAKSGQVTAFVHEIATGAKAEADPDEAMGKELADELRKVHVGWVRPQLPSK